MLGDVNALALMHMGYSATGWARFEALPHSVPRETQSTLSFQGFQLTLQREGALSRRPSALKACCSLL